VRRLIEDFADRPAPAELDLDLNGLVDWLNRHSRRLRMVGPVSKRLACGDVGVGGMAEVSEVVTAVTNMLEVRPD
jgi:phosphopantothenoylcysteine decarboxylase